MPATTMTLKGMKPHMRNGLADPNDRVNRIHHDVTWIANSKEIIIFEKFYIGMIVPSAAKLDWWARLASHSMRSVTPVLRTKVKPTGDSTHSAFLFNLKFLAKSSNEIRCRYTEIV